MKEDVGTSKLETYANKVEMVLVEEVNRTKIKSTTYICTYTIIKQKTKTCTYIALYGSGSVIQFWVLC